MTRTTPQDDFEEDDYVSLLNAPEVEGIWLKTCEQMQAIGTKCLSPNERALEIARLKATMVFLTCSEDDEIATHH